MELTQLSKIVSTANYSQMMASEYERHTVSFLSENLIDFKSTNFRESPFFKETSDRLNNKKSFEDFIRFFKFPHAATELIADIWDENSKLFSAKDQRLDYIEAKESDIKVDFNFWEFWKGAGYDAYKYEPNSIFVTYPAGDTIQQIKIPAKNVKHVEYEGGNISVLVYENGGWLWVFEQNELSRWAYEGGKVGIKETLTKYYKSVPAFNVSSRFVNSKSKIRTNVLNNKFASISDYLFFSVIGKINKGFAYWNTLERQVPAQGCDYKTSNEACQSGYMRSVKDGGIIIDIETGAKKRCPSCNTLPTIGGVTDIPYRAMADASNMGSAIKFITPDTTALKFTRDDEIAVRQSIFSAATGKDQNVNSNKNFNSELSIVYATEAQQDALKEIAKDLKAGMVRCAEIIGEIVFGDNFDRAHVNIGTNFLLHSKEQMIEIKKSTDELGISTALGIDDQLIELSSDGNEQEKRRAKVIILVSKILKADTEEAVTRFELNTPIRALNRSVSEIVKLIIEAHEARRAKENGVGEPASGTEE